MNQIINITNIRILLREKAPFLMRIVSFSGFNTAEPRGYVWINHIQKHLQRGCYLFQSPSLVYASSEQAW